MSSETIPVAAQTPARPALLPKISVSEYFAQERSAQMRHEYVNGEIVAMAGGTPDHNRITRNICVKLEAQFVDRPCESFIENIRTRVSATQYRYPDVIAVCEDARFDNENPPSLLNPALIVEVLSPSTEGLDRNEKFVEYGQIETLVDYILVAQDAVHVIHYARQSERQWLVTIHTDLNESLAVQSIGAALPLADIYRKIGFIVARQTSADENSGADG